MTAFAEVPSSSEVMFFEWFAPHHDDDDDNLEERREEWDELQGRILLSVLLGSRNAVMPSRLEINLVLATQSMMTGLDDDEVRSVGTTVPHERRPHFCRHHP
jgi:hypothetical protein